MDMSSDIRAIANGDRAAFTRLYQNQQRPMQAYAMGLLAGDREAAEDVVDDAFADVWNCAHRFTGSGHPQGWLRRIVHNKSVDWLRSARGGKHFESDEALALLADESAGPEDLLAASDERTWLRTALSALNVDQRQTVILFYYEELSVQEIADYAKCPESTVKTRLFHARKILRTYLGAEDRLLEFAGEAAFQ